MGLSLFPYLLLLLPTGLLKVGHNPTHPVANTQGSARMLDQDLSRWDNLLRFRVTSLGQNPSSGCRTLALDEGSDGRSPWTRQRLWQIPAQ